MSCIGKNIRTARRARGFSQEQLAQIIGVKKATISRYENGNREPRNEQLKAIATALDVTVAWLQGYETFGELHSISSQNLDAVCSCIQSLYPELTYEDRFRLIDLITCFADLNDNARLDAIIKLKDLAYFPWNRKNPPQD